ncbi:MAG: hypothetical protein R3Y59_03145 [bacterium]
MITNNNPSQLFHSEADVDEWGNSKPRLLLYADFMGFKSLVDAYLLQEQVKYYGIVVHHTAEKTVKECKSRSLPYINTEVNLDRGKVKHYHLCWNLLNTKLKIADNFTEQCEKWLEIISEQVSGFPRIYIDNTIRILNNDNAESMKPGALPEDIYREV